jgi:tetratricopeptide (TPR) repeat protein
MRYLRFTAAWVLLAVPCLAYSVLTHEAIIDSAWDTEIRPILMARYPNTTPDELRKAHAYVYGGCLGQDMGYAPFSPRLWSDLTHYVRSGDLVEAMLRDAQDVNEYAYAMGALAHYTADRVGHPTINRITAISYPKFRKKFGPVVTYGDNPTAHVKTEFSLDVVQVARQLYAPDAYHDLIGFEVAQSLLERAFRETYGFELTDIFANEDLAFGTFRWSVGTLIPQMTKVAWDSKRKDIAQLSPSVTRAQYVYSLPRRKFESEWGTKYKRPGFGTRLLVFIFRLVPNFGPFKALRFRPVTAQGEKMFLASYDSTASEYRNALRELRAGNVHLTNKNLDTGAETAPGEYDLADKTYAKLLDKLADKHFSPLTPALQANILEYYSRADRAAIPPKTLDQLEQLKQLALNRPATALQGPAPLNQPDQ